MRGKLACITASNGRCAGLGYAGKTR